MSLIVPNATDTTGGAKYAALDQAEPDSLDLEILSIRGSGVVSGCTVTSNNSASTVNVAGGVITLAGVAYTVAASPTLGLPSAPTDNRFDIVVARVSGGVATPTVVAGTNSATNPYFPESASVITGSPSLSLNVDLSTDVVLAALYRTGSGTVTASRIADKRVMQSSAVFDQGASAPVDSYGGTGNLFFKTGAPNGTGSGVYVKTSTGTWIELAQNVGAQMPIGSAVFWPSVGAVPAGCLEANGQSLSTSTYSALFAVYGYTHGGAGGTFNVPNYNGKFLRGTTDTSQVGVAIGADSVTLSAANMPAHTHTLSAHTHTLAHTHTTAAHNHSLTGTSDVGGTHAHYTSVSPSWGDQPAILNMYNVNPTGNFGQGFIKVGGSYTGADSLPFSVGVASDNSGLHQHAVTGSTDTYTPGNTTSQSTATTSAPSTTDTGSVGIGTSFSNIPGAAQGRWIIRASYGNDPSFVGGTAYWSQAQTINAQADNYTLLTTDIGNLVTLTNAGAKVLTVPAGLGAVPGQRISLAQLGAGQYTVTGSGATVHGYPGLKLAAQYAKADLICTATNTYLLTGDISA